MKRPLMLPLVPLYAAGLALRDLRLTRGWEPIRRLRYPVISIGNLSTGGSGKTPLSITLARLLSARDFHVDVLSRGYGRNRREPDRVMPDGAADQYGDEPLLIAREAGVPVYVAPERYDAGLLAEVDAKQDNPRPQVHILDDGFQHRQLHRDIDVLLVNREDWHDHLLPAGNLRETLTAIRRASALAIPSDDSAFEAELRDRGWTGPVWRLRRRMEIPQVTGPVVAFCGIARPGQFFAGLEAAGVKIADRLAFRDHFSYRKADLNDLFDTATLPGRGVSAFITTEKDLIRLGDLALAFPHDLPLLSARLTVDIEEESQVSEWLAGRLRANQTLQSL
ncbi:MAG TPA: tetraacyldisaccharide 4'-kinase [Terracidiphilus sp.]|nr:tetraacyldisaccharide 4'-kinase [Terracidiphilus sp.]